MLPLIGSRATCLILHPASSANNDHNKKDAPSLTYGVGRALARARQLHISQKPNAGSTGDLLRVDLVKAENPGNKQFGWRGDAPTRYVNGRCWLVCGE